MVQKKRPHPQFLRPNYGRSKRSRIKGNWRRPRGQNNKKKEKRKYMGASPSIGYGQPSGVKYVHPSGFPEVLVQSPIDLEGLKEVAIRVASGVGGRKRAEIYKLAEKQGLKILNRKKEVEKAQKARQAAKIAAETAEQEAKALRIRQLAQGQALSLEAGAVATDIYSGDDPVEKALAKREALKIVIARRLSENAGTIPFPTNIFREIFGSNEKIPQ